MVQPNCKFEKKKKKKNNQKIYFGSAEGDFNSRYNNHTLSLFSKRCKLGTELPKHV